MGRINLILAMLLMAAVSCSTGIFGDQGTPHEVSYIAEVTTIPEEVHVDDTVIIRYRIATEIIHDDGIYALNVNYPELTAGLGEITPVLAADYAAGDVIPPFSIARDNYLATQLVQGSRIYHDLRDVWQEPYYYMLYKAPDFAVEDEIYFYLGGGGPSSNKNRHTLKLKVRE
ncbi:hypothetical protein KDL29_10160 [bacterium]|nr:hypothetical protein [bacterium]